METPDFKNKWPAWKAKIQQSDPQFTDADLKYEEGHEEDLLQRLQDKRKQTKSEIYNWLSLMG